MSRRFDGFGLGKTAGELMWTLDDRRLIVIEREPARRYVTEGSGSRSIRHGADGGGDCRYR